MKKWLIEGEALSWVCKKLEPILEIDKALSFPTTIPSSLSYGDVFGTFSSLWVKWWLVLKSINHVLDEPPEWLLVITLITVGLYEPFPCKASLTTKQVEVVCLIFLQI